MCPVPVVDVRILYNNAVTSRKLHLKTWYPPPHLGTRSVARAPGDWILGLSSDCSVISSADAETNTPHMQFISSFNPTEHPLEEEFSKQPDIKCHALA
jgi:hypothetical protein